MDTNKLFLGAATLMLLALFGNSVLSIFRGEDVELAASPMLCAGLTLMWIGIASRKSEESKNDD